MSSAKLLYCFLLVLVVFTVHTWACGKREEKDKKLDVGEDPSPGSGSGSGSDSSGATVNACCHCGQAITMSLLVSNQIQEPFFEITTQIRGHPQRELIHLLETAATQDKSFRFIAQHYGSIGYLITTLNGLTGSTENKTYWQINSLPFGYASPQSVSLGVSSYIPVDLETVMFNFTSYANPGNH